MSAPRSLNWVVFNLSIPATVFKGLATKDLGALNWTFVGLFVLLRLLSALAILAWQLCRRNNVGIQGVLAGFLVDWIGTTWMNTIIFGIPMLTALYGPKVKILNILAAMGSLISQLPIMLMLFAWRQEVATKPLPRQTEATLSTHQALSGHEHSTIALSDSYRQAITPDLTDKPTSMTSNNCALLFLRVGQRLLKTPPMVAIVAGLLYSAVVRGGFNSTVFPSWIDQWVQSLGDCVTPLAAISLGLFAAGRERVFLSYWRHGCVLLASKVVLLPLLSLGLAYLLGLDGIEGRSAVLIASLPVAIAGFTLTQKYFPDLREIDPLGDADGIIRPGFCSRHEEYRLLIAGQVGGNEPRLPPHSHVLIWCLCRLLSAQC